MTTSTADRVADRVAVRITDRKRPLAEVRRSCAQLRQTLQLSLHTSRAYEQAQTDASRRQVLEQFHAGLVTR